MKRGLDTNKMNKKDKQKKAIKQLMTLKSMGKKLRLAADGWDCDWKTLIATLMSARTTDKKTIPTAEELFFKYNTIEKIAKAKEEDIANIIRPVNFYKTKAKHIAELAKILVEKYNGEVPHDFNLLIELPGVGRKTTNVFLAEQGHGTIGVDTHLNYMSNYLGWTKNKEQHKIEFDLEKLFPRRLWGDLNWIVVRFGQTYSNKKVKNKILDKIKII